jgi:hypothetical protein
MLSQWYKLENSYQSPDLGAAVALFVGCRIWNDASVVHAQTNNYIMNMCRHTTLKFRPLGVRNMQEPTGWMCAVVSRHITPTRSYPLGGSDAVFIWTLRV